MTETRLPTWTRSAACLVLLTAGILIAFGDVLSADRLLYHRDHSSFYHPYWAAALEALRSGALPGLTRADLSGAPHEMLPIGIYTPLALIQFLGELERVYDWFVLAHVLLLGVGVYVLARSLGATRFGACASSIVAALAGPVLSLENLVVMLMGLAYAPWLYWAWVVLLRRPSLGGTALLSFALGFHMQTPEPVLLILDLIAAATLTILVRPRLTAALVLASVAGLGLALGIASLSLMPLLEVLPQTRRGAGFTYAEASHWALGSLEFLEFFLPNFWAPPESPIVRLPNVHGDPRGPYFYSLYLGTALPLAAGALAAEGHRRARIVLLLVLGLSVVLALGSATPVHGWLWQLPLMRSARFPIKYTIMVVACLAAVMPLALEGLRRRPPIVIAAAAVQLLAASIALEVLASPEFRAYLAQNIKPRPEFQFLGLGASELPDLALASMKTRVVHAIAFAAIAVVLAGSLVVVRDPRAQVWIGRALIVNLCLDLAFAGLLFIPGVSEEDRPGPPRETIERIADPTHRVFRVLPNWRGPPALRRPGKTLFEDHVRSNALRGGYLPGNVVRRLEEFDRTGLSNPDSKLAFSLLTRSQAPAAEAILARLGVQWISSWIPLPGHVPDFESPVSGEPPEYYYRIAPSRPYAQAYTKWRVVDLSVTSAEDLRRDLATPSHWNEALILTRGAPPPSALSKLSASKTSTDASICDVPTAIELHVATVESIELSVHAPCPAVVVVLESLMPGWGAWVDGHEVPVFSAEFGNLAVAIDAGPHEVRLEYRARNRRWAPVALSSGLIAAVFALIGLFQLSAGRARTRRAATPQAAGDTAGPPRHP